MSSEKKVRIALIVSVCIFILGGIVITLSSFFPFLKSLSIVLLGFGGVASFFTFMFWTFQL